MTYSIILLERAKDELETGWLWYEDKQIGLGDRFKNEVFEVFRNIEKYPEHYPLKKVITAKCW